jgi:hypothetical protein
MGLSAEIADLFEVFNQAHGKSVQEQLLNSPFSTTDESALPTSRQL